MKFVELNSTLYINHLLLEEVFKNKVGWKVGNGLIKINFTDFEIGFQIDHSLLIFNDKKYPLNNLPFEQGENLWLPLEFFKILGIIESSHNDGQLRLTREENFLYYLEDVSLFHQDAETRVNIRTSAASDFKVIDNSPLSLTVQFYGATLKTSKKTISGDSDLIREINVEQISPDIIQLNLTLLKTEELIITQSQDNQNLIQIRKVQLITGLEWTSSGQGSELIINGDGELSAKVQKVKNAKLVQLDLDYAQFQGDLTPPCLSGDQGKSIHLSALNSHQVRLEIDLNYIIGYTTAISSNQRQFRIFFQHSPLVNKTFVIDPGHGGWDKGASGKKGTLEKEINLDVSLRLKNLLEEAGANVVLTRFDDTFISLYERAFFANFLMADFF